MPYKEKDISKLYFTIGEVAGIFNVNTSLIRYYAKEFDIIKPHKNKKGNRLFTQKDVDHFTRIFHFTQVKGLTLSEVKVMLHKGEDDEALVKADLIQSLKKLKLALTALLERL